MAVDDSAAVIHQIDIFLILLVQLIHDICKSSQLHINGKVAQRLGGRNPLNPSVQGEYRLGRQLRDR
ncbi:hypothetical protein D3C73_1271340 [compost metagenome]